MVYDGMEYENLEIYINMFYLSELRDNEQK